MAAGRKSGSEDSPASPEGIFRRTSVYETSFKYPLLRVEEQILRGAGGVETVVRQNVMVADHLMVQLNPRVSDEDFRAWLAERQLLVRRQIPNSLLYLVEVPEPSVAAYDTALVAFADKTSPAVSAEPDYIVQNHAEAMPPNDPSFGTLWNLRNTGQSGGVAGADVNALTAWSVSVGSANVVVGVIDTGMDMDHPDLAANLWTNAGEIPNDGIDNDSNGYIDDVHGWNFVKNTNTPEDDYGHGTHTAGTVGAVGNNGNGISGVCQQVKIMPLKFLDHTGSGSDSDAIEAIYYATAKGVLLTSNSWGGGDFTSAMKTAIDLAGSAGVGFIAAAGNDGLDNDIIPSYPANYGCVNLISVAATDANDQLSFFSNYGKATVHLAAPGEDVYSTYLSGGYAYSSGTSMATPHVSGAAALLKAANPGMNFAQIKAALLAKTDPVANLANKTMTGGRLDVGNAIDLAVVAYPVMTKATVQDANGPDTSGNGDSIISPGETVAVAPEVQNLGGVPTGTLQGTVGLDTPDPKISLANTALTFGAVAPAAKAQNAAPNLLITIAADHATPASIAMTLTLTDGAGVNRTESLTLNIYTVTTIAGHVTKVTGGAGLEGATVKLTGTVTKETTTGPDGSYIATVVDGSYSVQARAPGYVTSATQNVNVPPSATGVDFVLGASQLALDIPTLHPSVPEGGTTSQEITFTNN
ncbi:MAG TPA: S8 family serine peptidase, partial [Verrucomicrobium sp.]|nr:S8 family serine peptidase [Verrucomicrobium sp.]